MKHISILLLAVACSLAPAAAAAQVGVKTLLTFSGTESEGNLIFDSAGNLYGTTGDQYDPSLITVFKLSPNTDGTWTENVIWTATGGNEPLNVRPGVVFDASGNLYGTSQYGGASGCGTVFKLTHNLDGSWSESNLVDFDCGANGAHAIGGVTLDSAGNLYGTTIAGGNFGNGVVFQLTPNSGGTWTEKVLHHFTGGNDGAYPDHPFLVFDSSGSLYGSATLGGEGNCALFGGACGTIFKMTPQASGTWAFTVLHAFTGGGDGGNSEGTLLFDSAGNLYGTSYSGGKYGEGVVFKLVPQSNGTYREKVLHDFGSGDDGANPLGGVILDSAGNLFGTTANGGDNQCFNAPGCGIVYELRPNPVGTYVERILVHFHGTPNDGPYNDLVMDSLGNLFGAATGYNTFASGSIYEVIR
jgi:uncharacterized repeat protein (TIGR03803 family)